MLKFISRSPSNKSLKVRALDSLNRALFTDTLAVIAFVSHQRIT